MTFLKRYMKWYYIIFFIYILINFEYPTRKELLIYILVLLTSYICMKLPYIEDSILAYFLTFFFGFLGIMQPITSLKRIELFSDTMRITDSMLLDESRRIWYLKYTVIMYVVFMISICIIKKIQAAILIKDKPRKYYILKINPYILAIIYNIIRYLFQKKYTLLAPGKAATIPGEAIWVYLIRISSIIILGLCWDSVLRSEQNIKKAMIKGIIITIICSLPQALMGSRSEMSLMVVQFLILIIIKYRTFLKNYIADFIKIIGTVVIFIALAIYISMYWRTGEFSSLFAFLSIRITGIVDGVVIANYVMSGGTFLSINHLLLSSLGIDGVESLASIYTHNIIGYPSNVIHSYAQPFVTASYLYGGIVSLVIFSFIQILILLVCERKIMVWSKRNDYIYATFYVNVFVNIFFSAILEGSIDKEIQLLIVPLIAMVFYRMFRLRIKEN